LGNAHVPQLSVPPHPSGTVPQFLDPHVCGVHAQTFGTLPAPHVSKPVHVPQFRVPPHPSGTVPQFLPSDAHVTGVHPQTLSTPPPPHVSRPGHLAGPQVSVRPQPS
jgi:hypothetical protein